MKDIDCIYPRKRYDIIDIAKAIAIILVAIGHFDIEPAPYFYNALHTVIYTFHMPLFMFASGFLCVATWRPQKYRAFVEKKFRRLMVPYFVMSVIIIGIKLVTARFMHIDNPVSPMDFITMLWLPRAGYFLWFVYALWWWMVIYPFFNTSRKRLLLLGLCLPLYFIGNSFTPVLCLCETARMGVYFAAGAVAYDVLGNASIKKLCGISTVLFPALAILAVNGFYDNLSLGGQFIAMITAFSGIGFTVAVSYGIDTYCRGTLRTPLISIAAASYIIYLFHTTFMGFAKGMLYKIDFLASGNLFVRYTIAEVVVAIVAGVIVPYLLCRYVLVRFTFTRILFGLR